MSTSSKPTVKAEIKITVMDMAETECRTSVEVHGAKGEIICGITCGAVQICELLDFPLDTYLTACRLAEGFRPDQTVTVDLDAVRSSKKEDQA